MKSYGFYVVEGGLRGRQVGGCNFFDFSAYLPPMHDAEIPVIVWGELYTSGTSWAA